MSTSDDIVIVETTDYAQVVFEDVKETFTNAKQLECSFTLNELLKADESDWIGIYKVGFENCNDYLANVMLDLEQVKENKGKVVFPIEVLPKEDGEFYQFVYVSQLKQIRGASVPFQFRVNVDECTEFSDDEDRDAVVIKFEINDTITEIKSRCVQLSKANEKYEKLVRENEQLIKTLKEEVASIKLRCFRLTMDNEKLNFTLRNKADNLKNLAETISTLTSENNSLQNRFNELSNDNKNLLDSLQERMDQVTMLKNELEAVKLNKDELENVLNLKEFELMKLERDKDELHRITEDLNRINEQINRLEKQVDDRVEELNQIRSDLKKNNLIVTEQAQTIQNILSERDALNSLIQKLTKEKCDLESNQHLMAQELNMSKEKLSAAEQCKEMLRAQLLTLSDELEASKKVVNLHQSNSTELNNKLAQSEEEKAKYDEKINQIKSEYETRLNEFKGSYHVLRVAHTCLENRLKTNEQKRETLEKDNEQQKKTIEEIRQENEELKERIRHGALEYTKLFEKNRLLKNQKFNSEVNVYHDLTSDDEHITGRILSRGMQFDESQINSVHTDERATTIQDKTVSQSAKASSADLLDNTLLDALLGSSFYNGTWSNSGHREQSNRVQLNQVQSAQQATTIQPKPAHSQSSEMSDDGLVHSKVVKTQQFEQTPIVAPRQHNLSQQLYACQTINKPAAQTIDYKNPTCEICDYIFATDVVQDEVDKHYSVHYGPTCPVCFLQFHKGYPQNDLNNHVNSHFTN